MRLPLQVPSAPLLSLALALSLWAGCRGDDGTVSPGNSVGSGGSAGAGGAGAGGSDAGQGGSDAGAGGDAGGPVGPPVQFRVVTFNALNLFNDKADDKPPLGEETVLSSANYQAKLAGTAAILAKMNPDFVMLQEIENDAVLQDLQARPELGGRFVDRATFSGNDPRGIDLGALSTVPLTEKITHKNDLFALAGTGGSDKYKFSRDLLEVHATINGRKVIFLGVHLKAKANDDPQKRLAEAQRTRLVADQRRKEDPSAAVLILGDFNDFPGSPPMDAIEGQPPAEVYPSMGEQLGGALAWTVFSPSTASGKALHDDLRPSPWLSERLVKGSVKILHDDQLDPPLRDISDHAPVGATFLLD